MKLLHVTNLNQFPNMSNFQYQDEKFQEYGEIFVADLKLDLIVQAYKKGIFPYYSSNDFELIYGTFQNTKQNSTIWCSPEKRFILNSQELYQKANSSRNFRKSIKHYECRLNEDFEQILIGCKNMNRPYDDEYAEQWLTQEFIDNYMQLHELGFAHSIGAYKQEKLCGGLFGIGIGNFYSGDSMYRNTAQYGDKFTQNASKAALFHLSKILSKNGGGIIDCQYKSEQFERLGGKNINRKLFQKLIQKAQKGTTFTTHSKNTII